MNIFTKHPNEVGESYFQHMFFALKFSFNMLLGSIACFCHALFPFTFKKTGSKMISKMVNNLEQGNRKDIFNTHLQKQIES
ncbi:DUF6356 family protein [Legionella gresilensis]|uniref:DUF6356 family protein n=1 Tax=Legionella gresilensis TaxID=91823 RepID=UPI001A9419E6|nr:DUF6356 family protein [Legionella gresilensis]